MENYVAAVTLVPLLTMVVYVLVRNGRHIKNLDARSKSAALLLLLDILMISSGISVNGNASARMMLDVSVSLFPAMMMASSFFSGFNLKVLLFISAAGDIGLTAVHLSAASGILTPVPPSVMVWSSSVITMLTVLILILSQCIKASDVPRMLRCGTVWDNMLLSSDLVFMASLLMMMESALLICDMTGNYGGIHLCLTDIMLTCTLCLLFMKISKGSAYILMDGKERVIMESVRASQMEIRSDPDMDEKQYRKLYDRITAYFEQEKPYLRSELTIKDIVKVIYTNKLYISRAISLCSGRNFRQFVNYYRINYSMELFRDNPSLKIVELSHACGFNSVASFNMAFRLFMNQNPSEWCRMERARLPLKKTHQGK